MHTQCCPLVCQLHALSSSDMVVLLLVQDMLQQPVLLVLDFEAAQKDTKVRTPLDPAVLNGNVKMLKELTKTKDRFAHSGHLVCY